MKRLMEVFPELESERAFVYTSGSDQSVYHSLPVAGAFLVFFLKEEYQRSYGYVPISIYQSEMPESIIKKFSGLK